LSACAVEASLILAAEVTDLWKPLPELANPAFYSRF
jgi:hypothetical protein